MMTPQEALQILDQVAGMVQGTRADHSKITQAIQTLAEAIKPKERKKECKKK